MKSWCLNLPSDFLAGASTRQSPSSLGSHSLPSEIRWKTGFSCEEVIMAPAIISKQTKRTRKSCLEVMTNLDIKENQMDTKRFFRALILSIPGMSCIMSCKRLLFWRIWQHIIWKWIPGRWPYIYDTFKMTCAEAYLLHLCYPSLFALSILLFHTHTHMHINIALYVCLNVVIKEACLTSRSCYSFQCVTSETSRSLFAETDSQLRNRRRLVWIFSCWMGHAESLSQVAWHDSCSLDAIIGVNVNLRMGFKQMIACLYRVVDDLHKHDCTCRKIVSVISSEILRFWQVAHSHWFVQTTTSIETIRRLDVCLWRCKQGLTRFICIFWKFTRNGRWLQRRHLGMSAQTCPMRNICLCATYVYACRTRIGLTSSCGCPIQSLWRHLRLRSVDVLKVDARMKGGDWFTFAGQV